ncbi:MAG: 50S ribosomal protein L4 [Candidatus Hadarchaeum sp.]|uniref:50S ribosomal protein L4 n=1 Tax=Candidatus Hadarchaeum sp. TaxID=2883567 RepID=UPI003D13D01B
MKVPVFSLDAKPVEEIELPEVFDSEVRPDVIRRAVLAAQSARIQPWGPDPMAGKRTSAETWGKGFGVSRIRRVKGTKHPASGMGAFAPHAVGGRRAHPPRVEKNIAERINRKERRLAIRSAIAASKDKKLVAARGHAVATVSSLPLVVTDELESLKKTADIRATLTKLGLGKELERTSEGIRIRAGIGKMRGRRYKRAVGPLIVIAQDRGIKSGARNLPGVSVAKVNELNAEILAPGGVPGRLIVWTTSAIQKLAEGLYS